MQTKLERNAKRFEVAKNVAEIVAFLIAGFWAFFIYGEKDAPSLKKSLSVTDQLTIDSLNDKYCHASYFVDVKNSGKRIFEVDSVDVEYWVIPNKYFLNKTFYSVEDTIDAKTYHPYALKSNVFSVAYAPEDENTETFDFRIPRSADSLVVFRATAHYHGKKFYFFKGETATQYSFEMSVKSLPDKEKKESK